MLEESLHFLNTQVRHFVRIAILVIQRLERKKKVIREQSVQKQTLQAQLKSTLVAHILK